MSIGDLIGVTGFPQHTEPLLGRIRELEADQESLLRTQRRLAVRLEQAERLLRCVLDTVSDPQNAADNRDLIHEFLSLNKEAQHA